MKFKTQTTMMTASWRDVEMAENQGTITGLSLHLRAVGSNRNFFGRGLPERRQDRIKVMTAWLFLLFSIVFLVFTAWRWNQARQAIKDVDSAPFVLAARGVTT